MIKYKKLTWKLAKARKEYICCLCDETVKKGDWIYRPLTTDPKKRHERLCLECGEARSLTTGNSVFGSSRSRNRLSD